MSKVIFKKEITQTVAKKDQVDVLRRLAEVDTEILEVAAEKAEANSGFNKTLKDLRKEQKAKLDTLETGEECVEIDVYEEVDEARLEVLIKRADNDQVIPEFTRPMTPEERQVRLVDDGETAA